MLEDNNLFRVKLFVVAVVVTLLAACQPQAETLLPTEATTATLIPSATPEPTSTATATPLPPDLPFSGIFFKRDDPNHLYILSNSLYNWEMIEFPEGSDLHRIENALSPDKNWVVFETGSIEEGDLAINLMYLPDKSVKPVAELLSDRYPEDLLEIVDQLVYVDPENPNPEFNLVDSSSIVSEFEATIGNYAWSPNGQYLAFIGQMDGPSSDLYMYDLINHVIGRITADEKLVRRIEFSPDGETIVFEHVLPGNPLDFHSLHIADLSDRNLSNLISYREGGLWYISGWLSEHQLITAKTNDAAPNTGMEVLDVDTGQVTTIWPYYYYQSAVNIEDQTVLFGGYLDFIYETYTEIDAGLYFLEVDGDWEFLREEEFPEFSIWPYYWNGENSDFIIRTSNSLFSYSRENGINDLISTQDSFSMEFSPDLQWLVLWNIEPTLVIGTDENLAYEIPALIGEILWGPNSAGFFYLEDGWLKYISLIDGQITVLEPCPERECWIYEGEIAWLED